MVYIRTLISEKLTCCVEAQAELRGSAEVQVDSQNQRPEVGVLMTADDSSSQPLSLPRWGPRRCGAERSCFCYGPQSPYPQNLGVWESKSFLPTKFWGGLLHGNSNWDRYETGSTIWSLSPPEILCWSIRTSWSTIWKLWMNQSLRAPNPMFLINLECNSFIKRSFLPSVTDWIVSPVVAKDRLSQDGPRWHEDYFELKDNWDLQAQEKIFVSPLTA